MNDETMRKVENLLSKIPITDENIDKVDEIKKNMENNNYVEALKIIQDILDETRAKKQARLLKEKQEEEIEEGIYPQDLQNNKLEREYIGLLLEDPKYISKFYFLYENCKFEDPELENIYKSVIFTEGGAYSSEMAKKGFSFAKDTKQAFELKDELIKEVEDKHLNMENVYTELCKLFILRKYYLEIPIKKIQGKIVEIINYKLYDKMSIQEVENAVIQVNDTEKFRRGVLNRGLTEFLQQGDNNLRNGVPLPFPTLTDIFKGIRKGETMAYAMPSNAGKSRFTTDLAAHIALVHKKKVLVISNEMSEEKMKLCLITTIINNEAIQKLHGHSIRKTEGELLEFKYRPDDGKNVEVDEKGYVLRKSEETQEEFVSRLAEVSTEFNETIEITNWANKEIENSIDFINITDHTNDELKKVILNYYYKDEIEYVFYDTLKTDTENIGIAEELKKTATILSNLAQNLNIFICATLQLKETNTIPVNLTVNELSVSGTVKEVLDTLCLLKQINRDTLQNYEYSLKEVDTEFLNLKKYDDPDIRYYACVVDKNRAGAKPTLLFRLNLAYNVWEELGFLRLKQSNNDE